MAFHKQAAIQQNERYIYDVKHMDEMANPKRPKPKPGAAPKPEQLDLFDDLESVTS